MRRAAWLLVVTLGFVSPAAASELLPLPDPIREAITAAGPDSARQAHALARLAWPDGGVTAPAVSSRARAELVAFGDAGLESLRERLRSAPARFSADIASAIVETRLAVSGGRPAEYLPALYDITWFGSSEALRVVMYVLPPFNMRLAVLPLIDAAYEYPELRCLVPRQLGRMGDDRARFFLRETLFEGPDDCRLEAARALAAISGLAMEPLREAALSDRPELRSVAIDALLPASTVTDLTTLFEYLERFGAVDPERTARVSDRARQLDEMMAAEQQREAATPVTPK